MIAGRVTRPVRAKPSGTILSPHVRRWASALATRADLTVWNAGCLQLVHHGFGIAGRAVFAIEVALRRRSSSRLGVHAKTTYLCRNTCGYVLIAARTVASMA
jgi:hypothetical protein